VSRFALCSTNIIVEIQNDAWVQGEKKFVEEQAPVVVIQQQFPSHDYAAVAQRRQTLPDSMEQKNCLKENDLLLLEKMFKPLSL
jgi:hypothetical protein